MQRRGGGLRLAKPLLLRRRLFRQLRVELGQRQSFLRGADRLEPLLIGSQRLGFLLPQLADP